MAGGGEDSGDLPDRAEVRALRSELAAARAAAAGAEARVVAMESEKRGAMKRAGALGERVAILEKELEFHKVMEEAHASDRLTWEARWQQAEAARLEAAQKEVDTRKDLEEQLRDVMLALDMQAKLQAGGALEGAGGTVMYVPPPPPPPPKEGGAAGGGKAAGGRRKGK